ncbi:MAG: YicC family protein [Acidobacteria bacterium]|nr:YicC family protein [Acidobacteriota bacterium]
MLFSMTGFGEASYEDGRIKIGYRIRAVNHRALDINMRLPVELLYLEPALRKLIQERVFRGRIDIQVEFSLLDDEVQPPSRLDVARFKQLLSVARRMMQEAEVQGPIDVNTLLRTPDLIVVDRTGFVLPNDDEGRVLDTMERAIETLLDSRANEGVHLFEDVKGRFEIVSELVPQIESAILQRREDLVDQMKKRLDGLRGDLNLDESRLYQEAVFWADRLDVSEEITRLNAHLTSVQSELLNPERPYGKRLEFITQEILREVTTLGNKAKLEQVSGKIVTLKTELEKIREQLANIE